MILLDANILLYAYDSTSSRHAAAKEWLEGKLGGSEPFYLPWATALAFLRISTNPRALQRPLAIDEACAIVGSWLSRPNVLVAHPTERHFDILRELLVEAQAKGPLASDAHLAALAVEYGTTVCTTDRDFRRFRNVDVEDPL